MAQLKNITVDDTESFKVSVGTTAQRPASPATGATRFNTTTNVLEYYTGSYWARIDNLVEASSTGSIVSDIEDEGVPYRVHIFRGSGTFTPTYGGQVEYLIVAGGGGGGAWVGGGGGGGGVLKGTTTVTPQTYTITVGAGGTREYNPGSYTGMPRGTNGENSSAFGLTAIGGGRGGSWSSFAPGDGGSGGGSGYNQQSVGTTNQGNAGGVGRADSINGYPTGGGGGAANVGQVWSATKSGDGGIGIISTITGIPTYYAGGGGGGIHGSATASNALPGRGGLGGGGHGDSPSVDSGAVNPNNTSRVYANTTYPTGRNGASYTGGGGGGGGSRGDAQSAGGTGGGGIVVIRYKLISSYRFNPDPVNYNALLRLDAADPASYDYGANAGALGGNTWYDIAYARNGTLVNVPEFDNLGGGAISLTAGNDRYVTVPHDTTISSRIFSGRLFSTLEAWVNVRTFQNWTTMISKAFGGSYSNTTGPGLWSNVGGYQFVVATGESGNPTGSSIVLGYAAATNTWYHVVGVVDGVDAILYVNGVEQARATISGNITRTVLENTNVITLGKRDVSSGPTLEGWLSVVNAYDYPLSLGAIKQNFEAGRGRYGI